MSYSCGCSDGKPRKAPVPQQVIEINNPEQPVLFHAKDIDANLGDDTTLPPDSLNYRNVLLTYKANGHVYIYSSDGIPVKISDGVMEFEELQQELKAQGIKIEENTTSINSLKELTTDIENNLGSLENNLNDVRTDLENSINVVRTDLTAETAARTEKDTEIDGSLKQLQDDLDAETATRLEGEENLQARLSELEAEPVVKDAVKTYADLKTYDLTTLVDKDIIVVVQDETHNGATSYYRYTPNGTPSYAKGEPLEDLPYNTSRLNQKNVYDPDTKTMTVGYSGNGRSSEDITPIYTFPSDIKIAYAIYTINLTSDRDRSFNINPSGLPGAPYITIQSGVEKIWEGSGRADNIFSPRISITEEGVTGTLKVEFFNAILLPPFEYISSSNNSGEGTVPQATNTSLGTVKGNPEKVAVMSDGTLEVVGWEGILHDIENLTELVHDQTPFAGWGQSDSGTISQKFLTDNLAYLTDLSATQVTRASNLPTQVFYDTGPSEYNSNDVDLHIIMKDLHTGGDATKSLVINSATSTQAGVMSGSDKNKLNSLSKITSVSTGLNLSSAGALSLATEGVGYNNLSATGKKSWGVYNQDKCWELIETKSVTNKGFIDVNIPTPYKCYKICFSASVSEGSTLTLGALAGTSSCTTKGSKIVIRSEGITNEVNGHSITIAETSTTFSASQNIQGEAICICNSLNDKPTFKWSIGCGEVAGFGFATLQEKTVGEITMFDLNATTLTSGYIEVWGHN